MAKPQLRKPYKSSKLYKDENNNVYDFKKLSYEIEEPCQICQKEIVGYYWHTNVDGIAKRYHPECVVFV